MFLGYTLAAAVDPRDGQGGGRDARPRRADHRRVLDHRPAPRRRADRRSRRIAGTSTTGCSTSGCRIARRSLLIYGICVVLAVLALFLSGATQVYAFVGVFVASGFVLFILARGGFTPDDPGRGGGRVAGADARGGTGPPERGDRQTTRC